MRESAFSDEDSFCEWMLTESEGLEVPGLLFGDKTAHRFEAWFCDELLSVF